MGPTRDFRMSALVSRARATKPVYKNNWSEPLMNRNRTSGTSIHKSEGNVYANEALTLALGLRKKLRPNWSCCHIGASQPRKLSTLEPCRDGPTFLLCIGMVLLPTPLKAFTDTMPEIKAMLRICPKPLRLAMRSRQSARDEIPLSNGWTDWGPAYPKSWPRTRTRACRRASCLYP